jgi:lipopolysaccharide/colanic/teichoic acid biosynthesis glycosyltransferase
MSFVAPRPLLVEYLERYSPQKARRHEVKPAITGWAQINDRNALSRQEKFNRDLWYFAYWSLGRDFKILLLTPIKVIKHRGISHPNQATMNEFSGNRKSNE